MALSPGTRLGAYEILTLIGSGGMGEVYRARDTKLGREVALKILPATFTSDPDRVARFRREAQVLASVNHPHIGAIYGLDEANGQQFLVLELVDGESLDKRIARGKIPVDEALGLAKQIAEALEAAHEKGIIHRDLKPANIAVTRDGSVKVLDFGLAKATEPASGPSLAVTNSPTITSPVMMTGIGMILGTAAYMSPEQAKGRPADKRSDVWAFGCVFYEMLTGRRAFHGEDVSETLAAVVRDEPDVRTLVASPTAKTLIHGCLVKNLNARIRDLSTVLFLLSNPLEHQPAPPTRRLGRVVGWCAGLIVAAAVGLIAWQLRPIASGGVSRFVINLPVGQAFSNTGRQIVALSPNRTQLAYTAPTR